MVVGLLRCERAGVTCSKVSSILITLWKVEAGDGKDAKTPHP